MRKEKCQTLNEAIELALVLEDGKAHKFPWTRGACPIFTLVVAPSKPCAKDTREVYMIKNVSGTKRKVFAMVERAYNKSSLTPQQRDKAMRKGLCYGCLGQHKFKVCPKKARVSA